MIIVFYQSYLNLWRGGIVLHIVELKENLKKTSFQEDMIDISRLSRHINSLLDIATDINYTDYEYISTLSTKAILMLDKIDYILGKEMLQNVKHKE